VPAKPPPTLPAKKDVLLALLEKTSVFIHLDPRRDKVRVPDWFKKQPQLILQIGLNMPVPIRDLHVDDESVSCTLSFSRTPFFCYMPWTAIFAMVGEDRRGMVWPDDVPQEVAAQQAEQLKAQKKKRDRPKLRAVGGDADRQDGPEAEEAEETDEAAEPAGARGESGPRAPTPVPPPQPEAESSPPAAEEAPADEGGKRRLPPYLRVVK
jgi:stringent starvation protein B